MHRERTLVALVVVALLLPMLALGPRVFAQPGAASAVPAARDVEGLRPRPEIPLDSADDAHESALVAGGGLKRGTREGVSTASGCASIDPTGYIKNLRYVSVLKNGNCYNTDIDAYSTATRHYVIQGSRQGRAWTHYDVTDPARPTVAHVFRWGGSGDAYNTKTASSKIFKQGSRSYLVLGLERLSSSAYCGVPIFDITNPAAPVLVSHFQGGNWCDTHNVFVEKDASGNGVYIWATANLPNDLRVLDISGKHGGAVTAPKEVGQYRSPTVSTDLNDNTDWVHDITVANHGGTIGRRAYVSYWYSGLVILDADELTPGRSPQPLVGPEVIDPSGFRTHHAVPNVAGTRVFIQDEYVLGTSARPVQMWDISNLPARRPTLVQALHGARGVNGRLHQAHNLLVIGNELHVAWYKAGLQSFIFSDGGIAYRNRYHIVQTHEPSGWGGAWSVVSLVINGKRYFFQGDMNYGLVTSSTP